MPDDRLESLFAGEAATNGTPRWRQWLQRPAIAFAASFAVVLLLGAGAFALVARNGSDQPATTASPTSSVATDVAFADAELTLPEDLSDQADYAKCVLEAFEGWFAAGLAAGDAPRLVAACGNPPVPDFGPEGEAFRQDLQAWVTCLAGEVDALLPGLVDSMAAGIDEVPDPSEACGSPPHPRDYGLEFPFADFLDGIDPSRFEFHFEDKGDLEQLFKDLPEEWAEFFKDFDAGDFDWQRFKSGQDFDPNAFAEQFGDLFPGGKAGFEEWMQKLGDLDGEFDFRHLDSEALEDLDLDQLFKDLDLSQLFKDLELHLGDAASQDQLRDLLEGLDLSSLLADLLEGDDLDIDGLFDDVDDGLSG